MLFYTIVFVNTESYMEMRDHKLSTDFLNSEQDKPEDVYIVMDPKIYISPPKDYKAKKLSSS